MKLDPTEIIVRVKVLQDKKTQAIITLDFGDFVIKGFRVQPSKFTNYKGDNLWITPPSYAGGGRYHPIFFAPDQEKWKELEKKMWDEFYRQRSEFWRKFHGQSEEDWSSIS